jgi:hypothetical protein
VGVVIVYGDNRVMAVEAESTGFEVNRIAATFYGCASVAIWTVVVDAFDDDE